MATEFDKGFAAGWLAASRGLAEALNRTPQSLAMAGNKPGAEMPRRRGRPPKALSMMQPAKRGRGRPRKSG
jgi:AT hook motif